MVPLQYGTEVYRILVQWGLRNKRRVVQTSLASHNPVFRYCKNSPILNPSILSQKTWGAALEGLNSNLS